jgi:TetR/AcrR family transcriptional regulator, transcriptional repressor for nem operon
MEKHMGYSASDTAKKHQLILDESIRLFRERGFSGVSVSELMSAAGLTHGPFYNHFASKESLMSEALAHEMDRWTGDLDSWPPTQHGKARYVDDYLSTKRLTDCGGGCPVAALASEVRHEQLVQPAFTDKLKAYIQKFAARFPWRSRRSARGDAIHMFASLVGALILARAVNDNEFAQEILIETRKRIV